MLYCGFYGHTNDDFQLKIEVFVLLLFIQNIDFGYFQELRHKCQKNNIYVPVYTPILLSTISHFRTFVNSADTDHMSYCTVYALPWK